MQPELAKANLDSPGRCSIAAAIMDSERSQQGWSVGHRGVLGRHTDNAGGSSTACRVLGAPCCGRQTLAYVLSRAKHDGVSYPEARWHGGFNKRCVHPAARMARDLGWALHEAGAVDIRAMPKAADQR